MDRKKIMWVVGIVIAVIILTSVIGGVATWYNGTIGRASTMLVNEEKVRIECQAYRTDLELSYTNAKNTYTQEVVLTVQDLANVANLSNENKRKLNNEALTMIFQESTPSAEIKTDPVQNFIVASKGLGVQYDKEDNELYRQISRAVRDGRFKFNQDLKEFAIKEKNFKDYINETRVEIFGTHEILNMSNYKGCFNSEGGTVKYDNADQYFNSFKMPTTLQTQDAFSVDGFDKSVLGH